MKQMKLEKNKIVRGILRTYYKRISLLNTVATNGKYEQGKRRGEYIEGGKC